MVYIYIYNYIYIYIYLCIIYIYSIHGFSNPISLSGGYHLVGRSDITIIPVELEKQDTIPVSHDIPTVMARNTSKKSTNKSPRLYGLCIIPLK